MEDLDSFKGCDSPTAWLKDSGAPVLWVHTWDDLEDHVQWALDNPDELGHMQAKMLQWWDDYRQTSMEMLVSFASAARSGEYTLQHECKVMTRSQEKQYQSRMALQSYYNQANWYTSFEDSADLCALFCTTSVNSHIVEQTTACFSESCAPSPVEDFTCVLLG